MYDALYTFVMEITAWTYTADIDNNDNDTAKRGSYQWPEVIPGHGRIPHCRTTFQRRLGNRHTTITRAQAVLRQDRKKERGLRAEME